MWTASSPINMKSPLGTSSNAATVEEVLDVPQRDIVSQVITASAKAVSINYCCPNACVQHCDSERALPVDIGPRDSDNKHSSYQLTVRATAREWTSCTKHLRDRTISVVLLLRNVSSRVHLCVDKKRSVPSENQGGASTPTARKGVNYGKIEILNLKYGRNSRPKCSERDLRHALCVEGKRTVSAKNQGGASTPTAREGEKWPECRPSDS